MKRAVVLVLSGSLLANCLGQGLEFHDAFTVTLGAPGEAPGASFFNTPSPNGKRYAFYSSRMGLVPKDLPQTLDLFHYSTITGRYDRVNKSDSGYYVPLENYSRPVIGDDGKWILFSTSTRLASSAVSGIASLYRRDLVNGRNARLAVSDPKLESNRDRDLVGASEDGQRVLFVTRPANKSSRQLFTVDVADGRVRSVSHRFNGSPAEADSNGEISQDGKTAAFVTLDDAIVTGPPLNRLRLYFREIESSAVREIPLPSSSRSKLSVVRVEANSVVIRTDGALVWSDDDGNDDLYRVEIGDGSLTRLTTDLYGNPFPLGNDSVLDATGALTFLTYQSSTYATIVDRSLDQYYSLGGQTISDFTFATRSVVPTAGLIRSQHATIYAKGPGLTEIDRGGAGEIRAERFSLSEDGRMVTYSLPRDANGNIEFRRYSRDMGTSQSLLTIGSTRIQQITTNGRYALAAQADDAPGWRINLSTGVVDDYLRGRKVVLSADGRYASLLTEDKLSPDDKDDMTDVYLYSYDTKTYRLVSRGPQNERLERLWTRAAITSNNRFMAIAGATSSPDRATLFRIDLSKKNSPSVWADMRGISRFIEDSTALLLNYNATRAMFCIGTDSARPAAIYATDFPGPVEHIAEGINPALSLDGRFLAYSTPNGLNLMELQTRKISTRKIPYVRGRRDFAALSRDGGWLAFGPGIANQTTPVSYIVLARPAVAVSP